jgi:hypothetical protein
MGRDEEVSPVATIGPPVCAELLTSPFSVQITVFLGLLDTDWIHKSKIWIRIRILLSSSKINKKSLDSYCLVTSFGPFVFENDVNVPSKSNKQENF